MMETLIPVAGIVAVAAITPGPNNFIVMAAARSGAHAAVPAAAGVVAGTLALLSVAWTGAGAAFHAAAWLRPAMTLAGASYLCWLGGCLMWHARSKLPDGGVPAKVHLPSSGLGVAAFQFLNPKSWVLVLTATAAMAREPAAAFVLAAIFVAVTLPCLALWAVTGSVIAERLTHPAAKAWFERSMGALLICSALLLVFQK